jgi:hypothetical protein
VINSSISRRASGLRLTISCSTTWLISGPAVGNRSSPVEGSLCLLPEQLREARRCSEGVLRRRRMYPSMRSSRARRRSALRPLLGRPALTIVLPHG